MILYLLTTGDGSDGNEWHLLGIYSTRERAAEAQRHYAFASEIEEWPLDPLEPR